ncbi:MAG: ATP-binding protein [Myxococcota bacterium]
MLGRFPRGILPPLLFAVVAVPSLVSWRLAGESASEHRRDATQLVAEEVARRVAGEIAVRVTLVDGIRRELEAGQLGTREAFEVRALEVYRSFPGYQAINRLDASGVIRQVVPERSNQAALGKNVRESPVPARTLAEAERSDALTLSEPLELYQGGLGFVGYVPVSGSDGATAGFLNVAFRINDLVHQALSARVRAHYALRLALGERVLFRSVDEAGAETRWPDHGDHEARVAVPVGNAEWALTLVPLTGVPWSERFRQDAALAMALVLALALAVLVWSGQRRAVRLAALETRLRQQQRLEAIGTFAAGMAHEINNPLTGILGYAAMLQDGAREGSPERERAGRIVHEAERVQEIVRGLLRFARREVSSMEAASPATLVEGALVLVRTLMRDDSVDLRVDVPADLPAVRCHTQGLQQVLMNLLTNARDAVAGRPEGTRVVTLSARRLGGKSDARVRFTVEDNGVGIARDVQARIFEPFFTTKGRERGTGLGLSVSFGIVRDHGGELHVESQPGQWTRFHVDIPVWEEPVEQPHAA